MRQVVVGTDSLKQVFPNNESIQPFQMNGFHLTVGLIETEDTSFEADSEANNHYVLVRIKAFSCNYRDKGIMINYRSQMNALTLNDNALSLFKAIGSDFMGEVMAVGSQVTTLSPGDRVISDSSYPFVLPGGSPGIPSNNISKELEIFHYSKLIKIPPSIKDEVGGAFTIGGVTAYSMVRKMELTDGDRVLVTAAKSNTSLFVLQALRKYKNIRVIATSTNQKNEDALLELGIDELVIIDPQRRSFLENEQMIKAIQKQNAYFNKVIDPFYDLHLGKLLSVMDHFGKYTTCGLYNQYESYLDENNRLDYNIMNLNLFQIFGEAGMKNIELIHNCLGLKSDLQQAIDDYDAGNYDVLIDSVYTGNDVFNFLDRTYNQTSERLGKVVYRFD